MPKDERPHRPGRGAAPAPSQSVTLTSDENWARAWRRCWTEHPEILIEQRRIRHGAQHLGLAERQIKAYSRGSFYNERFARPIRAAQSRRPA